MNGAPVPGRLHAACALPWVAAALWVTWQFLTSPQDMTWGWDESMHAELPAARMALYLRGGDIGGVFQAIHDCTQYPFVWPGLLGVVQAFTGPSEEVARTMGVLLWGLTMVGAFMLTRAAGVRIGMGERETSYASWGALAACAMSPLAAAYAGTLFHEVPSACVTVWALVAWLRRDPERPRTDLIAGAAFALAFFTKFNYGLLLGAVFTSDFFAEWIFAAKARSVTARQMGGRALRLAIPTLALGGWWFFLPLPGGAEMAAVHRDAFLGFLVGNLETEYLSAARRLVEWGAGLHAHPRVMLLALVGFVLALRTIGRPGGHLLGAAALIPASFLWVHPFHLDRFLVPFAPALWSFAAIGLAGWVVSGERARRPVLLVVFLCVIPVGGADSRALAGAVGLVPDVEPQRAYVLEELKRLGRQGSGRRRPTAGLRNETAAAILDAAAGAVGPMERVGWLSVSSELSPGALHIGLLERGGEIERFLRDAHRAVDMTFEGVDPGWDDERFAAWAKEHDVVFMTDPPDLGGRRAREFMRSYQERLLGLGWRPTELGTFELQQAFGAARTVRLFACRLPS